MIKYQEDKVITSKDFSKQSLEGQAFVNCTFENCHFKEANLNQASFSSCCFKCCDFSLTKIDNCRFQDCRFEESKIVGLEFFKCDTRLFSIKMIGCVMQYCNFSDLNMKKTSFKGSKVCESHFTNVDLQQADFGKTDLSSTIFHNCNLFKANFIDAINYFIDPKNNNLKEAKFSFPEAISLLEALEIKVNN